MTVSRMLQARGVGACGGEGGFLELDFADEVIDLDHEEAAAIGEDLGVRGVGLAGPIEQDGPGELGELGLGEGAELSDFGLLGGITVG